ncbi:MAG TPA: peptidase S10 [Bryobacteraceae bacterium]|nr:peptidase S10 [Bryobacteraceae bacterium]
MKYFIVLTFAAFFAASAQTPRPAAAPPAPATAPASEPASPPAPAPVETASRTRHEITLNGKKVPYTATAGTLILKKDDGKPWASMFYVAYTRDDAPDPSKRPLTFSFNGGPGSSSVWLHLGALGPKRVELGPDGEQPKPPYHLVDNQDSALEFTDLVFIDPVSTGFSREAPGENAAQFHGYEGDLKSVAEFIRLYCVQSNRWASPKFLAGESYGTTRAAALSEYLIRMHGIYLNGITLISSVLNFETISFASGHDLPYELFLPTYTAAAWYHKKLPNDLQGSLEKAIGEARRFAGGEYTAALMKGDKLTAAERADVTKQMARLTGLSQAFLTETNLRVSPGRFEKELLRGDRKTLGRYDSRLEGVDADAAGDRPEYDASYAAVQGAFTAAFNAYVRGELDYKTDLNYEVLTDKVNPWSFKEFENRYVNVAERLREAMTQNHDLHVVIANGYYDLATPFFATEYTVSHLGLDPSLASHISLTYCEAGHMLYTKQACLDSLHATMADFYEKSASAK